MTLQMESEGFACTSISSDLDHAQRDKVITEFRHGTTKILISTDVLARGFDVQQVRQAGAIVHCWLQSFSGTYTHPLWHPPHSWLGLRIPAVGSCERDQVKLSACHLILLSCCTACCHSDKHSA